MRRSRTALTLFLGALAAALQSAGFMHVQSGMATEPFALRRSSAAGPSVDCYAAAPGGYLDTYEPDYDYGCDWDCGLSHPQNAAARVHVTDIGYLAADPRHSTGHEEVLRINRENEGLQAASLSTGDHPRDLPSGEALYFSGIARSRISSGFDYDDVYHGNGAYSDCYGAWDGEYNCELEEPSDLPPGETVLHVARQHTYSDDYDYDDAYEYGDESGYVYDAYGTPYAANARAALPSFVLSTVLEPSDLPAAETFIGDLPPAESLSNDLPPGEDLVDDMPPGENFDDLPPAESGCTAPASNSRSSDSYENDYDYGCGSEYDVQSYGDYGDCDAWHNRSAAYDVPGTSLRPLLRTASWILSHMADALLGLSKSCDQMADAARKPADDAVQILPPETDYPWPTIIGRQPQRNQSPGL